MSYKQLPNGKHHWNFRLGGRNGHRKKVTNSDFKQGEREVRRIKYEFENGILADDPQSGIKFHDICKAYLKEKKEEPGATAQRIKTLTSQISCFEREIPNYRLEFFNVKKHKAYNSVDTWMKAYLISKNRLGGTIKPQSVNRKFNTLRAVFNWAIARGHMMSNPCKRLKKLKTAKPLPRFLTQDEIDKLVGTARRQKFVNYCTLILNTGMRPGEALNLQIEHISLPQMIISGFEQKNKNELGSVPIKESLVKPLIKMIGDRTSGSLLNYTPGELREDAEYGIKKAGINAVIKPGTAKFTIYGLRHTFASHMLNTGVKLETVAKWLRNGIEICFEHYSHLTQQFMTEAGNKIDLVPKIKLRVVGDEDGNS